LGWGRLVAASWNDADVDSGVFVGGVLVTGPVIFLVGAVAWRLDYQRPLQEALPVIDRDRGRRAWIHTWMISALVATPAGLAGLTLALAEPTATVLAGMAAAVYGAGGVCWIVSLAFRLTVVPWAAERATAGHVPDGFAAYDRWAGALYVVHMLTAYVGSAVLGMAVLASDALPTWLGWAGSCGVSPLQRGSWRPGSRGRSIHHSGPISTREPSGRSFCSANSPGIASLS
jgi:hypothetical protein